MSEPFVGQMIAVGFNFAPSGWLLCNGASYAISEYTVLYNLIGTTYGGNGTTTFNVPNLCGRAALSMGTGNGLSTYVLGQTVGTEYVTLQSTQMAQHTHVMRASSLTPNSAVPGTTTAMAANSFTSVDMYSTTAPNTTMLPAAVSLFGGNQPHENRQPFLAINYIIAAFGIFPQQS
jgi:microcystin-dependent protein